MYDIAIIGLGPAGATLARLLDKRFKVIVIDKKSGAEQGFQKPCGGLLAVDAQKALSKFNLTLPKSVLVDPQIFAVKTIDLQAKLLRYYQRFYINLDRHKFDNWLITLIPPNVEVISDAVCSTVKKTSSQYEISYIQNGETHSVTSRFVAGADGSDSTMRKALFPCKKIQRYLSIQQWFTEQHAKPFYSCIFDSTITDSYCWSISKDGFFILGGAFPLQDSRKRFESLKEKLKGGHGFEFGNPIKTEACMVSMPKKVHNFCTGKDGAFLIGEAAGFISPSSLEGISYALSSACALAETLNSRCKSPDKKYRKKTAPIRFKLLAKNFKKPFMYRPFLRKLVMKSGFKSVKVIEE